ncbi:4-hydroxy-tetrahydrodipicolinate synthase [Undibacterium sp.]|jgi:4-hydroxy-tetrahydrodipicolinate synthase|uniref:4-hydroxy-tetrahydrodipicolinate synthase n=1 Tax=Undibacterium sp. TaxID=1914977 RepID=UPI002C5D0808|nr:4-hydroxy-tetrahydrodipicolinate synthase [Undibacterium sp.]HTD06824.1 4-hydroxy-tetrahydrodipicolinate synthase [Undibacterium sp.]
MSIFEGIWIPLVTPFRNGKPDLDRAQQLALKLLDAGTHGLVVCGTTGEAAALSEKEQTLMLAAILEVVQGACPVLMGIGGSDTRALAEKVARLDGQQSAGFLVSAPCYVRPSQEGIRLHFEAIAQATGDPIVLYNIPSRTGVNIDTGTVIALQQQANIVAIKECGGNLAQMAELVQHTRLKILCGDDALLFHALCLGGHGAISAAAHIRPELFVRLYELTRAGEIASARALFYQLLPLIQLLFSEPNPAPLKAALAMQGYIQEELRLPMTPMSKTGRARLAAALDQLMAIPGIKTLVETGYRQNTRDRLIEAGARNISLANHREPQNT